MYEFNYHRPASLDEAKQILAANAEAKIIAGGMTLLPTMKLRLAQPSDLVDLSAIDGLDAISDAGSAIDIGAMARHADVAHSEVVRSAIPALADLADAIGDAQVRNRGTLGGSIANSDPAADYPAAARDRGGRLFSGYVRDRPGRRRARGRGVFSQAEEGGLREVPQPGVAVRDRRRDGGRDR
jgi:carbon-monoxide dehydrogenase medium subunit